MIGPEDYQRAFFNTGIFNARQNFTNQRIRLRNGLVILLRTVPVVVTGVVHVIEMHEAQYRFFVFEILNEIGSGRIFRREMLIVIHGILLE